MFQAFPKIPRLNRDCVVTEKIDGTNAAIVIVPTDDPNFDYGGLDLGITSPDGQPLAVYAQSRKRIITPGKATDNHGFAGWVQDNITELVKLGPGRHFGEWWGKGINRGYGLDDKRFSLFNVHRWHDRDGNGAGDELTPYGVSVVPVVGFGAFVDAPWEDALCGLRANGSAAAPGFDSPEGVVVFHQAAKQLFKVTLEGDERPKSAPSPTAEKFRGWRTGGVSSESGTVSS